MAGINPKFLATVWLTRPQAECLLLAVGGSGQTLLLLTAGLIVARRLSGNIQGSLPSSLWIAAVVAGIALWFGVRWFKAHMPPTADSAADANARRWTSWALAPGAAAIALVSLQRVLPAGAIVAMIVGWSLVAASESVLAMLNAGLLKVGNSLRANAPQLAPASLQHETLPTVFHLAFADDASEELSDGELSDGELSDDEVGELLPTELLQQITRNRTEVGEAIEAVVRCQFAAGETLQVVHIAFCPPLAATPELQIDLLDESDATIKETTVASYGVRLEIRLPQPAIQSADVLLRLYACAADAVRRAA